MKNLVYILILMVFTSTNVNSQTLEQILEKYYEAVGMEYLKNVLTIQYKGKFINHFLENDGKTVPDYFLYQDFVLSIEKQKAFLEQVYGKYGEDASAFSDGKFWRDPSGAPPEERTPNESDHLHIQLNLDTEGLLFNWKNKGYSVVKLKDAVFENKKYYKIRLTTPKRDTLYYYINPQNNLIFRMSYSGDLTDGKEHKSVTLMNYKKVQNIFFPFKQIHRSKMLDGTYGNRETVINEIRINPKFDKELFNVAHRIINQKN
jgi:hypothetical protein